MRKQLIKYEAIVMPENSKISSFDINFRDGNGWQRFVMNQNISAIDIKINYVDDEPYRFKDKKFENGEVVG